MLILRTEQIEFLQGLMSVLELSGFRPKLKIKSEPRILIKLREMHDTKLFIYANPENYSHIGSAGANSKMLEVRYANIYSKYNSLAHFTGDLGLVEGWSTLMDRTLFVDTYDEVLVDENGRPVDDWDGVD